MDKWSRLSGGKRFATTNRESNYPGLNAGDASNHLISFYQGCDMAVQSPEQLSTTNREIQKLSDTILQHSNSRGKFGLDTCVGDADIKFGRPGI